MNGSSINRSSKMNDLYGDYIMMMIITLKIWTLDTCTTCITEEIIKGSNFVINAKI